MRTGLSVMKTGFSLLEKLQWENPVEMTENGCQFDWSKSTKIYLEHSGQD